MRRKICVVTGSRAEYGLLFSLMKAIQSDPGFLLQVIATGSHLSQQFGMTYEAIENDGFVIDEKIKILTDDNTAVGVVRSLGNATVGFAGALERLNPDLLVLLGDRYEILAAAQAALILKIPIAHIAGGDSTEGAFDEAIRHSITKMSHLHFVTNAMAAERVRQLGENPACIFNVGNPGIDLIHQMARLTREEFEKALGFKLRKKNLLVTFHPETLDKNPASQSCQELLAALESFGEEVGLIFTKPNADPDGLVISKMIEIFVSCHKNSKYVSSLGQKLYFSAMAQVDAVVGNSSSGLCEAPSFKKPTVNIGDRQKGRLRTASVIDCEPRREAIMNAIQRAFTMDCSGVVNPYGDGHSSVGIVERLKEMPDPKTLIRKHFFDDASVIASRSQVYIIAETGVNHNGSIALAKDLIDHASKAGADAVKFQTFKADTLLTKDAEKAPYQKSTTAADETQWAMIQRLEMDQAMHEELFAYCQKRKIDFLSTPFDLKSVDLLVEGLGLKRLKVSSGEITNGPLLLKIARTKLPLILSTGMATLKEIEEGLSVIAFGYTRPSHEPPDVKKFQDAYRSPEGQAALREKVILLHCTSEYPAPFEEANLLAMGTLRNVFGLPTGLSDHTLGIAVSIAAVARGAVMIEKHLTLDRDLPGPDQKASLEPEEFKRMVQSIREVEQALGSLEKKPSRSESKNIPVARKSLVAAKDIRKGEVFSEENLSAKRPGTGISPMRYWDFLGKSSGRDFQKDEAVH